MLLNSKDNYTPLNALNPPSIGSNAPVTKLAASLHRNCTAPFSSLISPKRFIGVLAKTFLLRSVSEPSGLISTARFWSPMKKPGAIAFTRMPSPYFSASSLASH
jgi:hypothetical protein